jgi:hypothetical protein
VLTSLIPQAPKSQVAKATRQENKGKKSLPFFSFDFNFKVFSDYTTIQIICFSFIQRKHTWLSLRNVNI